MVKVNVIESVEKKEQEILAEISKNNEFETRVKNLYATFKDRYNKFVSAEVICYKNKVEIKTPKYTFYINRLENNRQLTDLKFVDIDINNLNTETSISHKDLKDKNITQLFGTSNKVFVCINCSKNRATMEKDGNFINVRNNKKLNLKNFKILGTNIYDVKA